MEVSANLGYLSNHLDVASELGVGPAQTLREAPTPASSLVSPGLYQTSPSISTTIGANPSIASLSSPIHSQPASLAHSNQQMSGLLPSLPVVDQAAAFRRVSPAPPINTSIASGVQYFRAEPATADFLSGPTQPPPLVHSHSFPNGHQLPSQLHGLTPSTPIVPSASFNATLSGAHMPMISSPLVTMPVSRPPSPPGSYPIPDHAWADVAPPEMSMLRTESDLVLSQRPSAIDGRLDGRPVITRSRSISINKSWANVPTITTSAPPSAWQSRIVSSDEEDDEDSEDEAPKRTKRRRSSATRDDAPDAGFLNGPVISDDIRRQLDQIFEEFLNRICSDREFYQLGSTDMQSKLPIAKGRDYIRYSCRRRWPV